MVPDDCFVRPARCDAHLHSQKHVRADKGGLKETFVWLELKYFRHCRGAVACMRVWLYAQVIALCDSAIAVCPRWGCVPADTLKYKLRGVNREGANGCLSGARSHAKLDDRTKWSAIADESAHKAEKYRTSLVSQLETKDQILRRGSRASSNTAVDNNPVDEPP